MIAAIDITVSEDVRDVLVPLVSVLLGALIARSSGRFFYREESYAKAASEITAYLKEALAELEAIDPENFSATPGSQWGAHSASRWIWLAYANSERLPSVAELQDRLAATDKAVADALTGDGGPEALAFANRALINAIRSLVPFLTPRASRFQAVLPSRLRDAQHARQLPPNIFVSSEEYSALVTYDEERGYLRYGPLRERLLEPHDETSSAENLKPVK